MANSILQLRAQLGAIAEGLKQTNSPRLEDFVKRVADMDAKLADRSSRIEEMKRKLQKAKDRKS